LLRPLSAAGLPPALSLLLPPLAALSIIVIASMGGTLGHFTWFHCTLLGSRRVRYYGPMPGCDIDRSGSLASCSQAYAP
jgi:hypothetical protein